MIDRTIRWLVSHPWLGMVIILGATFGAVYWGVGIEIRADMEDLFPDNAPSVLRAERIRKVFGSRSELQVLVGGADQETNRAAAKEVADALESYEFIQSVDFFRDIDFFRDNGLLFLPLEDVQKLHDDVVEAIQEQVRETLELDAFDLDEDEEDAPEGGVAEGADGDKKSRIPNEAEIRDKYQTSDLTEYYESPDGGVIAVKAYPKFKPADATQTKAMNDRLRADIETIKKRYPGKPLEVILEGDYSQLTAAVSTIKSDLNTTTTIALTGIALIVIFYFRRLRAVLLVLVPLIIGMGWTLFAARATIGYLNIITALIFAILLGLGIDFVVHAASRMDEEFRSGKPLELAIPVALKRLGRAMIAAALTTMATFAALGVLDFKGFSQFGIIAAMGVACCLAAVYVTMPPLAIAMNKIWKRRQPKLAADGGALPPKPRGDMPRKVAWGLIAVFGGLGIAGGVLAPGVAFETDTSKLRPPSKSRKTSALKTKYRREAETRTSSPAYVLTDDMAKTEKLHRHLKKLVDEKAPHLKDVVSIFSFVPDEQLEKITIVKEIKRRVDAKYDSFDGQAKEDADELARYLSPAKFAVDDLPKWVLAKFTDAEGGLGRIVALYLTGHKSNAKHINELQRLYQEIEVGDDTFYSTANYYILGDAFSMVKQEGPKAIGLACLVVILLLSLDFRNAKDVALVFLPLVVGFSILMGILSLAGFELNIYNMIVLPIIFGIGVDTAIHVVHRLKEGSSVREVLRTTGMAAATSSLTTAMGFFSLVFVSIEGMQSIGWIAVIGIACSFLATVLMTCALVSVGWRPSTPKHAAP